ncbi:MAG: hypothetical protein A3C30_01445 [Candidatus Levybacteria bacterium RIFCSPHIGHO2_02_FULL_40_18]|nr:MAG: hypothetical protein A2869_01010 [Candidatus Levybacteria bacterium RIFCSPHIGHO2_01_FULL_40_58]OGH26661.1 MAG: hypothetical protein A3C30_01445 [Candidatus Levybacteria bacterium RIFCSPHIGHO2_02_FULL_40_18]OGH31190.1 MAG: hypothetical protein A3E43_00280 [Candidatus Levybacteria bacterium RIFCSPHIGHO2_12_FULL_40_31]OGH39872.1 MAG: hypothetical protein A2894_03785 [Candidatus Levybacteria bacterium RIFCSPLOWO2_01_FULL_40_64]OGH48896.1 MAG: hypothetical protein A3I54_04890 [Candidatus Lev
MKNRQAQDRKFEKKMKYYELIFERWENENRLWHEYPDEMSQSTLRLSEKMLKYELIKCKHEKPIDK